MPRKKLSAVTWEISNGSIKPFLAQENDRCLLYRKNVPSPSPDEWYDRFRGMAELMPYAAAASAKEDPL